MLDEAPCPCSEGYVCCQATQTCAEATAGCEFSLDLVSPTAAPTSGGTPMLIVGAGFVPGVEVSFNEQKCLETERVSGGLIQCVLPLGVAGPAAVEVRLPDEQRLERQDLFAYKGVHIQSVTPIVGPSLGGQQISIMGSGFSEGMRVLIGDGECSSVQVTSSGVLSCVTPPHAGGLVSVLLISSEGELALLDDSYFYEVGLSLLEVSPNFGPVSGGTEIVVLGSGFEPQMEVLVAGSPCSRIELRSLEVVRCETPVGSPLATLVDVEVRLGPQSAKLVDGFRYLLPDFVDHTMRSGFEQLNFGTGLIVFEQNKDGLLDIFLPKGNFDQDGPIFYQNQGGLLLEDVTAERGLGDVPIELLTGGAAADYNNDGHLDLLIAGDAGDIEANLLTGAASLQFTRTPVLMDNNALINGAAALDLDGDHAIDWLGCRNVQPSGALPELAYVFLRNDPGGFFEDASVFAPGAATPGQRCKGAMAVGDIDLDGDQDLVSCSEQISVMLNDAGRFTNVTEQVGLPRSSTTAANGGAREPCTNISLVDVDSDGDLDVSVVHRADADLISVDSKRVGVRIWLNTRNQNPQGPLQFRALPESDPSTVANETVGICGAQAGWLVDEPAIRAGVGHVAWTDRDLDGDLDLLLPIPSILCARRAWVYDNELFPSRTLRFALRPLPGAPPLNSTNSLGMADLDNDGDQDYIGRIWGHHGGQSILRNNHVENGGGGRFLKVHPISDEDGDATDPNDGQPDRTEPSVTVQLDLDGPLGAPDFALGFGKALVRTTSAQGSNFPGLPWAHFGLGERTEPVWARVQFPDGSVVTKLITPDAFDSTVKIHDCAPLSCDE